MRQTRQRTVIQEELARMKSHPTVDELFHVVRKRLPRISLATVYRNLEVLTGQGVVKRLDFGGPPIRFDADLSSHHHARCIGCGRTDDIRHRSVEVSNLSDDGNSGYDLLGFRLEFFGFCPRCRSSTTLGTAVTPDQHFSSKETGGRDVSSKGDQDRT